jgi:hypothetical protein
MNQRNYHLSVIQQVADLVSKTDSRSFTLPLSVLGGASLGQHVRHIVEFYVCLVDGISASEVNYEKRKRDLDLETVPAFVLEKISEIQGVLNSVCFEKELVLEHIICDSVAKVNSTIARELLYLAEHTVHHFALIKIGIVQHFPDIKLPQNFGVADSTVRHLQKK